MSFPSSSLCHPESCPYEGTQEKSSDKAAPSLPILVAGAQAAHPSPARGQDGDLGILATRLCAGQTGSPGETEDWLQGPQGPEKNGVPVRPGTEKARGAGKSGESTGDTAPCFQALSSRKPRPLRGSVASGTSSLKQQESGLLGDPGARVYSSHSMGARVDLEPVSPRSCLTKVELAKSRLAGPCAPRGTPHPCQSANLSPQPWQAHKSPYSSLQPSCLQSHSTKVVPRPVVPPATKEPPNLTRGRAHPGQTRSADRGPAHVPSTWPCRPRPRSWRGGPRTRPLRRR